MSEIVNNIFYLPVQNDFLVYSPLNGISVLLNRLGLIELQKQIELVDADQKETDSNFYELASEILKTPASEVIRKTEKLNPAFLGLLPTRACNGVCNYCDFGAEKFESDKMSYEIAVETVDWYTNLMLEQNRQTIEIHFFGGEPMVAFDVIEVAVHRARLMAVKNKLFPYFEISTNGQFSEEKAKWLGNYFNTVVLSFDGFREVQNMHRPLKGGQSSYENVYRTAKVIGESNAELNIRCCVSQLNIKQLEEITHWFCQNFRLSILNFEVLTESEISKRNDLFAPDPIEFAIQFQKSREIARNYGVEVVYASDISSQPQVTSCPVGRDTAIVSPDGRISNCYLLQEKWQEVGLNLDFGSVKTDKKVILNNQNIESIRNMVENKPRCENCFCKWSCSGGCHVGTTFPGSSNSYDNFCKQTRLISAFTLLEDLNMEEKISTLYNEYEILERMAIQESDNLTDFAHEETD